MYSTEHQCPVGWYSNSLGLQDVSECLPCPGGYYCDAAAQTDYTKICQPGYVRTG
jgi:hypothetical protein